VFNHLDKEDLDLHNHLSGKRHKFLKLSFNTVSELIEAKSSLLPVVTAYQKKKKANDGFDYQEEDEIG